MARRLEIDRKSNLSRGLVFCAAGGEPVDLVTGNGGTYGAASKLSATTLAGGAHQSTTTAGTDVVSWPRALISSQVSNQFSILVANDATTYPDWATLFSCAYQASWSAPFQHLALFRQQNTADISLRFYTGSQVDWIATGSPLSSTGYHVYCVTRSGINARLYKDGVFFTSTASLSGSDLLWNGTVTTASIFSRSSSGPADGYTGKQSVTAVWNRVLSAGELATIGKDVTRFLRPQVDPTAFLGLLTPAAAVGRRQTGLYTVT